MKTMFRDLSKLQRIDSFTFFLSLNDPSFFKPGLEESSTKAEKSIMLSNKDP